MQVGTYLPPHIVFELQIFKPTALSTAESNFLLGSYLVSVVVVMTSWSMGLKGVAATWAGRVFLTISSELVDRRRVPGFFVARPRHHYYCTTACRLVINSSWWWRRKEYAFIRQERQTFFKITKHCGNFCENPLERSNNILSSFQWNWNSRRESQR